MAFKMSFKNNHNNATQKLQEITDIHQKTWGRENTQTLQSLKGLRTLQKTYQTLHVIARLNNFRQVINHTPKKRIIFFKRARHHRLVSFV